MACQACITVKYSSTCSDRMLEFLHVCVLGACVHAGVQLCEETLAVIPQVLLSCLGMGSFTGLELSQ